MKGTKKVLNVKLLNSFLAVNGTAHFQGATTLSITTLSMMTLSTKGLFATFSITTLSITILSLC